MYNSFGLIKEASFLSLVTMHMMDVLGDFGEEMMGLTDSWRNQNLSCSLHCDRTLAQQL